MTTRKHIHEETFDADPETIFNLLVTPSAIRQWWDASHVIIDKKQGGRLCPKSSKLRKREIVCDELMRGKSLTCRPRLQTKYKGL